MDEDYSVRLAELEGWVEAEGDELLGVIVLEANSDHLWVDNVAVGVGARDRGIGKALLSLAADRARDRGLGELRLLTHELMASNLALYEHLGWAVYEPDDREQEYFVYFRKPAPPDSLPGASREASTPIKPLRSARCRCH